MNIAVRLEKVFDLYSLVGRGVVANHVDLFAARLVDDDVGRNATNSAEAWREWVLPSPSPILVLKAA